MQCELQEECFSRSSHDNRFETNLSEKLNLEELNLLERALENRCRGDRSEETYRDRAKTWQITDKRSQRIGQAIKNPG